MKDNPQPIPIKLETEADEFLNSLEPNLNVELTNIVTTDEMENGNHLNQNSEIQNFQIAKNSTRKLARKQKNQKIQPNIIIPQSSVIRTSTRLRIKNKAKNHQFFFQNFDATLIFGTTNNKPNKNKKIAKKNSH